MANICSALVAVQARSQGESRYNSYAQSGASRWAGGGWGERSSGRRSLRWIPLASE